MQRELVQARYTIRYRCCVGHALIVEDGAGSAYVFDGQGLYFWLGGTHAPAEIATMLHRLGWRPVPPVAPYTLNELSKMLLPMVSLWNRANATSAADGPATILPQGVSAA